MKKVTFILLCLMAFFCAVSCKKKSSEATIPPVTEKIIPGNFYYFNGFHGICKTHDGRIGLVAVQGDSMKLYVAIMNASLDILWERTIGSFIEVAGGITEATDGGIVIACNDRADYGTLRSLHLFKLSSSGALLWEKKYRFESGIGEDYAIVETPDRGFMISVAYHIPDDTLRFYPTLFKIGQNGDSLWSKGIPGHFNCYGFDLGMEPDRGFLVAGPCGVTRTDSLGNVRWDMDPGIHSFSLEPFGDGSYDVAVAGIAATDSGYQARLVLVDAAGNKRWEKILARQDGNMEIFNLCRAAVGGFACVVRGNNGLTLVRTDSQGNKLSEQAMDGYVAPGLISCGDKLCCYTMKLNQNGYMLHIVVRLMD